MNTAVIVAAGVGSRFGDERPKQYLPLCGVPMVAWSLRSFDAHPEVHATVLVVSNDYKSEAQKIVDALKLQRKPLLCVGGAERVDSVKNGLAAAPEQTELVAIHDAARPLVSPGLISRALAAAHEHGAAVPVMPLADTLKRSDGMRSLATVDRNGLYLAQTPQVFRVNVLQEALDHWVKAGRPAVTDDAQLAELAGHEVRMVPGEVDNFKITTADDFQRAEGLLQARRGTQLMPRSGIGFDVHRLVPDRKLIIGGVEIAHDLGLLGHSDADVLAHAIGDALLGAAALGDLGYHFPPSDPRFHNADSLELLTHIGAMITERQLRIAFVDSVVACEAPKLAPHIGAMRRRLAASLSIDIDQMSVKATTTEQLGFTGRGEGIAAYATALLMPA